VLVRRGAGVSIDGHWYCSEVCIARAARRRILAMRPPSAGVAAVKPLRLGALLRQQGALSADQLQQALAAQEKSRLNLGTQVCALGYTDAASVLKALAAQAGVAYLPAVDPSCVKDAPADLSPDTVEALRLVPFGAIDKGRIKTACTAPVPRAALAALRQLTGLTPEPYLVTDATWTSLATAYANAVQSRPASRFVTTNSLSDAVARIAAAAASARQARMTEAQWAPYTWVRVEGRAGVVQDVLLAKPDRGSAGIQAGLAQPKEVPCQAASTSH
jgi:hypothetical protein